jgi:hypothetical protein
VFDIVESCNYTINYFLFPLLLALAFPDLFPNVHTSYMPPAVALNDDEHFVLFDLSYLVWRSFVPCAFRHLGLRYSPSPPLADSYSLHALSPPSPLISSHSSLTSLVSHWANPPYGLLVYCIRSTRNIHVGP